MNGAKKNEKDERRSFSSHTKRGKNVRRRDTISFLHTPERELDEIPQIAVKHGDFDEEALFFKTAQKLNCEDDENVSTVKPKKILWIWSLPTQWRRLSRFQIFWRIFSSRHNLGVVISVLFHLIVAIVLLSIVLTVQVGTLGNSTTGGFSSEASDLELVEEIGDSPDAETSFEIVPDVTSFTDVDSTSSEDITEELDQTFSNVPSEINGSQNTDILDPSQNASSLGGGTPFFTSTGTTQGRRQEVRTRGLPGREGDVTKESEDAVERGLEWLARHQLPDGGWSFDLTAKDANGREGQCNGQCSNSSSTSGGTAYKVSLHPSRTAATAIAVLPFLGAGYTHKESNKYQKTVSSGLRFLEYNAISLEDGSVDFRAGFVGDGAAYVQALAVLACCEAYEMTKDPNLRNLAEGGLKFIEASQLQDGGWRYNAPGDLNFHANVPGDTSVLGWQMLALKSGISAGFQIRASVAYRAGNFLDLVMSKDGSLYRYQPKSVEKKNQMWGTTAVGVLIREYLGWEPGNRQLDSGVEQIAKWMDDADSIWQKVKKGARGGNSKGTSLVYFRDDRLIHNLYFSYYATLALHHYGGKLWKPHFAKIREFLIATQSRGGALGFSCENGSWLFYDTYMNDGGRLLNTSLAVLILETPYRYLPMYQ